MSNDLVTPRESAVYLNTDDRAPVLLGNVQAIGITGVLIDNLTPDDQPVGVTVWAIGPKAPYPNPDVGP
jgi:hypothetical protein